MPAKKPSKQRPWTPSEKEDITTLISVSLTYGMPIEAIVVDLCDAFYKMTRSAAVGWINRCKNDLAISNRQLGIDEDTNRGIQILRYENVYALAMQRGDFKSALAAAKELGAIQGVLQTAKTTRIGTASQTNIENMNFAHIPDAALENLGELTDAQIKMAWVKGEFTEKQAKRLYDESRGQSVEED